MYKQHFGLREAPFSITPDPRFFYANSVYLEAYANLRYGIEAKKGFIAVTGEVGTGKTTLLRKLMLSLENTVQSVFIFNTELSFTELLRVILRELGLPVEGKDRLAMIEELNEYLIEQLSKGHIVCLLIDEVQNLSDQALEGLRLLSNLETDQDKLLQIVLMGQPELKAKLDQPHLRQLKQRIAIQSEITPLKSSEIASYITFRLNTAGYQGKEDIFDNYAVEKIAFYSKGIPRLINVICDNALLIAFAASQKTVSAHVIEEVVRDLRLKPSAQTTAPKGSAATASDARRAASVAEPANRFSTRTPTTVIRVVLAIASLLLIVFAFASLIDPQTFFVSAEKSLNDYRQNLNRWALLVSGQSIAPQKIMASPAGAETGKPETARRSLDRRVTISYGSTIYQIATDTYGADAMLGMDLIKEFNPQISNLNWVNAGEELLLPALSAETLIRQQPDGSFRVTVASFLTRREADKFAYPITRDGYRTLITTRRVANNLLLYRLEVDGLTSLEEASLAIEVGRRNGWLPSMPTAVDASQPSRTVIRY